MPVQNPQSSPDPGAGSGCLPSLARLIWIFGGIALVYCALYIAQGKSPALTGPLMLLLTLGLILVRFVDIRYLKGETLDNKPATLKHWRRYALMMAIVAGALYAVAKFAAQKDLL